MHTTYKLIKKKKSERQHLKFYKIFIQYFAKNYSI